jgi:hypothetical protein
MLEKINYAAKTTGYRPPFCRTLHGRARRAAHLCVQIVHWPETKSSLCEVLCEFVNENMISATRMRRNAETAQPLGKIRLFKFSGVEMPAIRKAARW